MDIGACASRNKAKLSVWDVPDLNLRGEIVATDHHCYGCTAGAGSSCSGALTQP
jgi:hypothetical protein